MKKVLFIASLLLVVATTFASEEITPYKFTDADACQASPQGLPLVYNIPASSRFTAKRPDIDAPDIVYYFSAPKAEKFPIAILCGGSSSKENIGSIIHVHRYLLKEFLDLNIAVLTVEQWGVDGEKIAPAEFLEHYTRSQRLYDHQAVIEHLKLNPPERWNGKLIFLGVSEGGPIVTSLTTAYPERTLATINWSGAGDWSWREELWAFLGGMKGVLEEMGKKVPETRQEYDDLMDQTLVSPDSCEELFGMTYKYHADALTYPVPEYQKIRTPFLVVAGAKDTIIHSSDAFVEIAKMAGADVTYLRVLDMDHYVRKRPDIIDLSFEWLKKQLH